MPIPATPLIEQFNRYVCCSDGASCWMWSGPTDRAGYGMMSGSALGRSSVRAHRFSYEHHVGPIPNGLIVRHKCDVPGCVNPDHLEVGTQKDNIEDRVKRGRNGFPVVPRKLSSDQIEMVRLLSQSGAYQRDIAAEYGVSQRTVSKIVNGLNGYGRNCL